jgi:D-tyrosyl-tRNA(Tyr) deacylase
MRVVVQRVAHASVEIDGAVVGRIGPGLAMLLGIRSGDGESDVQFLADKVLNLRVFPDAEGKMNRSALDAGRALLVVSQFTLYGDCRKGRRPSFIDAAPPNLAEPLYDRFIARLRESGLVVESGRFGAMMQVELVNDGPVTLIIDSPVGAGGDS